MQTSVNVSKHISRVTKPLHLFQERHPNKEYEMRIRDKRNSGVENNIIRKHKEIMRKMRKPP